MMSDKLPRLTSIPKLGQKKITIYVKMIKNSENEPILLRDRKTINCFASSFKEFNEDTNDFDIPNDSICLLESKKFVCVSLGFFLKIPDKKNNLIIISTKFPLIQPFETKTLKQPNFLTAKYLDEIYCILYNPNDKPMIIKPGDNVCQIKLLGNFEIKNLEFSQLLLEKQKGIITKNNSGPRPCKECGNNIGSYEMDYGGVCKLCSTLTKK
ncbi:MAG: hypothetical protein GY870_08640 [archaeon]|nr:hypothetical protein [archaeon]